jgi:hypothetical protein
MKERNLNVWLRDGNRNTETVLLHISYRPDIHSFFVLHSKISDAYYLVVIIWGRPYFFFLEKKRKSFFDVRVSFLLSLISLTNNFSGGIWSVITLSLLI